MKFQTAMAKERAETVFRSVVSGITATSVAASLQAGEPVVLLSGTGGDGIQVVRAFSSTDPNNNLWVGNVDATIAHEGIGLAQCYGIDTDVRLVSSATVAVGDVLIPQVNSTATQITGGSSVTNVTVYYGAAATGTTSNVLIHGLDGLAIAMAAATAVTSTAGTSTVTAHLRLL